MVYSATVLRTKGTTRHLRADRDVAVEVQRVEIEDRDGLFFLMRYDDRGAVVADTAHLSLDEARRQAGFEYDLQWESGLPSD